MKRSQVMAGLAGLLLFLVAYIPAPLAYHWLGGGTHPQIQAHGLGGTLWRGQAAGLRLYGINLYDLNWRWRPLGLLVGRLSYRVETQGAAGPITAVVSTPLIGNRLRISHLNGGLPIAELAAALRLQMLALDGRLQFEIEELRLRNGKPWAAEGKIVLAGLALSQLAPGSSLGDYRIQLETPQKDIQILVSSESGQLEATGAGTVSRDGRYSIDLKLRPRALASAAVIGAVRTLGKPDGEGWYRLRQDGSF